MRSVLAIDRRLPRDGKAEGAGLDFRAACLGIAVSRLAPVNRCVHLGVARVSHASAGVDDVQLALRWRGRRENNPSISPVGIAPSVEYYFIRTNNIHQPLAPFIITCASKERSLTPGDYPTAVFFPVMVKIIPPYFCDFTIFWN